MIKIKAKIIGDKEVIRKIEKLAKLNNDALKEVMLKSAILVEGNAKEKCPVLTGRLRSSITHDVKTQGKKHQARIGTNVEYAPHVEFGTKKQAAKPYLLPGLKESRTDIIRLLTKAIKGIRV